MAPEAAARLAAEVADVAGRYRLALHARRFRGRLGGRRGHGVGSSQEFLDFRGYTPGDDLRYLDWRSYARTDQLRIRLHQEEVAPHADLLIDTSASMAATAAKEHAVRALAQSLRQWTLGEGTSVRALALGGAHVDAAALAFEGPARGLALPAVPLRQGALRVLVTDGLWPDDPTPALQRAMAGASRFHCLQVLDPWELEPPPEGALTLHDCETGERREVHLDAAAVRVYRDRLHGLVEALRRTVAAGGGTHVVVRAGALAAMCARDLLPAGVVEPA
jgi:uncharacterized protein (DUF58 family)